MSEVNLIAVTQPKITKDGLDAGLEPSKMTPMSAEEFIALFLRWYLRYSVSRSVNVRS